MDVNRVTRSREAVETVRAPVDADGAGPRERRPSRRRPARPPAPPARRRRGYRLPPELPDEEHGLDLLL